MGSVLAALHRGAEAVWPLLQSRWAQDDNAHRNQPPYFSIEVVPETMSTNATLMDRIRLQQAEPCILVAAHQSAGRGRMGTVWRSAVGHSLTFSMALPLAPRTWSGLSLAVGVSLAERLSVLSSALNVQLKWPNDLWLHEQKLAGILIETAHIHTHAQAQRWAVIGIGINLYAPTLPTPSDSSLELSQRLPSVPPTGLCEWGLACDVGTVLAAVAPALLSDVLVFQQHGFGPFQARFAARDVLWQQALRLSNGVEGVGMGVDDAGVLQVQTSQGLLAIHSQEVSVRPRNRSEGTIC